MGQPPNLAKIWLQYRIPLIAGSFLILLVFYIPHPQRSVALNNHPSTHTVSSTPREQAANSTLGFEVLLALSERPGWRTRGLTKAAELPGFELTIPPQPKNPPELTAAFEQIGKDEGKKTPAHGSATAWLAHVDLLKHVIASGYETVLIVEDDVDFDVRLKEQIKLISDNVRMFTQTPSSDATPYGKDWDVLWLGHCGSLIEDGMRLWKYGDETRCVTELYSGWSKHYLRDKLEENYRYVQNSVMTVCTFGYGVNRRSAQNILSLQAKGGDEAFDVSLQSYCRSGRLNCVVVTPQVFNHYEPPKDAGYLSPVHVGDEQGDAMPDSSFEDKMGFTGNVMKSARCKALFDDVCMRPPSEI